MAEAISQNNKKMEEFKYNSLLPDFMQNDIIEEVKEWKESVLSAFEKAFTEEDWGMAWTAARVFLSYSQLRYPLSIPEKERLCSVLFKLAFHENITAELQAKLATILNRVMRNKQDLNLQIDWKPIYKALTKHCFKPTRSLAFAPSRSYKSALVLLAQKSRKYFSPGATDEILATLRPQLCIHDNKLYEAQGFLWLFLPTLRITRIDWLEEVLAMWSWSENNPLWDRNFVSLLARTADESAGYLNWDKYLPTIYTRVLRALDMAAMYNGAFINADLEVFCEISEIKNHRVDESARLLVWLLNPNSTAAFDLLRRLLKSIESLFHPSNSGHWTGNLARFLISLAVQYSKRLLVESKPESRIPAAYRLNESINDEFVKLLLPLSFACIYGKNHQVCHYGSGCLKQLSTISPSLVFPQMVEKFSHALQTLTETHQTVAAIETLGVTILPMLNKKQQFAQAYEFLYQILMLTLPGIDANDNTKTSATVRLYMALLSTMPLIPSHSAAIEGASHVLSYIEDWAVEFITKILDLLAHVNPKAKKEKKHAHNPDEIPFFKSLMSLFFFQLSPQLHKKISGKVLDYVNTTFVPTASKMLGDICCSAARVNKDVLASFITSISRKIIEPNMTLKNMTDTETSYYLYLLSKTIAISPFLGDETIQTKLLPVLRATWNISHSKITKSAGKLLRNILSYLTTMFITEYRSVNPSVWNSAEFENNSFKSWGEYYEITSIEPSWYIPTPEAIASAVKIYNEFIQSPFSAIQQYLEQPTSTPKADVKLALKRMRYILKGASLMLPEIQQDVIQEFTRKGSQRTMNSVVFLADEKSLKYTRLNIAELLHRIASSKESDVQITMSTIKAINALISYRHMGFGKYAGRVKMHRNLDSFYFKTRMPRSIFPRPFILDRTLTMLYARYFLKIVPCAKVYTDIANDLLSLSLSGYSKVRSKAQSSFVNVLKNFDSKLTKSLLPSVIDVLGKKEVSKDELNGAIFILKTKTAHKRVYENWDLFSRFMVNICMCYHLDTPNIQTRLNSLFVYYIVGYRELKIASTKPLKPGELSNTEKYNKLIHDLLNIAKIPNLHWRYQVMIYSILVLLIRSDVEFPADAAVQIFQSLSSDIVALRECAVKAANLLLAKNKPYQERTLKQYEDTLPIPVDVKSNVTFAENQEQWQSLEFQDKNYFGWNAKPKQAKVYNYAITAGTTDVSQEVLESKKKFWAAIKTVFVNKEFLSKFITLSTLNNRNEVHSFNNIMSQLFKGGFQIYKLELLDAIKESLEMLLSHAGSAKPEEKSYTTLAGEIIAGMSRGMKHWSFTERQAAITYVTPLLKQALKNASQVCILDWSSTLRTCVYDLDIRRTKWITEMLMDSMDLEHGTSLSQAKSLIFLSPVLNEAGWRDINTLKALGNTLATKYIAHPYQQVRDIIASSLFLLPRFAWQPQRDSVTKLPILAAPMPMQEVEGILQSFSKTLAESKKKSEQTKDDTEFKAVCKTFALWFQTGLRSGFSHVVTPHLIGILPLLAMVYTSSGNDHDLEQLSSRNFGFLATILLPETTVAQISLLLPALLKATELSSAPTESSPTNTAWRVKLALLSFIQAFAFRHQFLLLKNRESEDQFFGVVLGLLSDKTVEVREAACNSLAVLLNLASEEKVKALIDHFTEVKKKVISTKITESTKQLLASFRSEAHYASLGLSAIVRANPYDIPPYLPNVLMELASLYSKKNVGQQVTNSVKGTFSHFMKLHKETWHLDKSKFTEEQLYTLNELSISQNYYA